MKYSLFSRSPLVTQGHVAERMFPARGRLTPPFIKRWTVVRPNADAPARDLIGVVIGRGLRDPRTDGVLQAIQLAALVELCRFGIAVEPDAWAYPQKVLSASGEKAPPGRVNRHAYHWMVIAGREGFDAKRLLQGGQHTMERTRAIELAFKWADKHGGQGALDIPDYKSNLCALFRAVDIHHQRSKGEHDEN